MTVALRLLILGPLQLWRDASAVDPGPSQQAALLAILLARAEKPISTSELVDLIWDENPPASAANIVQKHVGSLRRLLEPALAPREPGSYLYARSGGYLFRAPPDALDLHTFRRLTAEARATLARDDRPAALDQYARALSLWRGPAGQGLVRGPATRKCFAALDDEFFDACATAADLAMSLGSVERIRPRLRLAASMASSDRPVPGEVAAALAGADGPYRTVARLPPVRRRPAPALETDSDVRLPVAQPPARPAGETSLVGRRGELAALRRIWTAGLAGGTGLALVEGEPGAGKTRLLTEASEEAGRQGALVVWGRCPDSEGTPSMWPWMQAVGAILDALPSAAQEQWRSGDLAGLLGSSEDTIRGLPDESTRFRLFESIVGVVREASARRPTVLVIDDLHWADAASLRLFSHLTARLPSGSVVFGALRDRVPDPGPDLSRMLAAVSRLPGHRRLPVKPLDRAEVAELLLIETGTDSAPELVDAVHGRTAGNPFFVQELARSLAHVETGRTAVPESVRDVVGDRIGGLSGDTLDLLYVAALIGRDVDLGLLAAAVDTDVATCLERIEPLYALSLVELRPMDPYSVRFAHDLVREAVAAMPLRTAELHLSIADAIQRDGSRGGPAAADRLAHHLWSAGPLADPARTAEALLGAGRRALTRSDFETAEQHLRSATQVARTAGLTELELSILTLVTNVRRRIGDYRTETLDLMERAEELALGLGREAEATDFLYARMIGASLTARPDTHELARRLRDRGLASGDPVTRAYGSEAWGLYQWDRGELGDAYEQLSQVDRTVFPALDENPLRRDLQLHARLILAVVTALHGDLPAARTLLHELDVAAGEDAYAVSSWAYYAGTIAEMADDPALAARAIERWTVVDPERLFRHVENYLRLTRCWVRAMTGDDAGRAASEAEEIFRATLLAPSRWGIELYAALICDMWLAAGRPDRATTALAYAERAPVDYADHSVRSLLVLSRARLLRARGEPSDVVRAVAERARALAAEQEAHLFAGRAERFLAEVVAAE
ncbi:AAA family ATPase [Cryptosporangium phraense]|uniref:AAA family ATPase n=1 Tax=Cryptosporangium phraense TaxID=2593070 RepID=UPI00197B0298